jgi:hypothetical protein
MVLLILFHLDVLNVIQIVWFVQKLMQPCVLLVEPILILKLESVNLIV